MGNVGSGFSVSCLAVCGRAGSAGWTIAGENLEIQILGNPQEMIYPQRCGGSLTEPLGRPQVAPTAGWGRNQSRLGLRPDPVGTESQPTKMRAPCAHLTPEDSTAGDLRSAVSAGSETLAKRGRLFPAGCLRRARAPRRGG